jgi:hypothetical protein
MQIRIAITNEVIGEVTVPFGNNQVIEFFHPGA